MRKTVSPVLLVLFLAAGCSASREEVINRTSIGLTAARAAFTAEDERMQLAIVDAASSKAEAETRLAEHRRARDAGTKAFQAAWAALAVASLQPTDANVHRLMELAAAAVTALNGAGGVPK